MGGLLDKANKEAEKVADKAVENTMEEPSVKEEKSKPEPVTITEVSESSETPGEPPLNALLLQLLGIVSLLVISFIIFYSKYFNIGLFAILLAGSWGAFAVGEKMMGRLNPTKIGATIVVWIIVASLASGASYFIGSSKVTVGMAEVNGNTDSIDITLYGTSGNSFEVSVLKNGVALWTEAGEINLDKKVISAPLADVFDGNALDHTKETVNVYSVQVVSGESTDSYTLPPAQMNHEANAGVIQISEVFEFDSDSSTNRHDGMEVNLLVGIGDTTQPYTIWESNSTYSGPNPVPITTDMRVEVSIAYGGNKVYTYSTLIVEDGTAAGIGEISRNWVRMPGTGGAAALSKESFYQDDGCYTFTVKITNEVTGVAISDSRSALDLKWNDNDSDDDADNNEKPSTC